MLKNNATKWNIFFTTLLNNFCFAKIKIEKILFNRVMIFILITFVKNQS